MKFITACTSVLAVVAATAMGCAMIRTTTEVTRTLESKNKLAPMRTSTLALDGCVFGKGIVSCVITADMTCTEQIETIYTRIQKTERSINGLFGRENRTAALAVDWTAGFVGAALLAGGSALMAMKGEHCFETTGENNIEETTCIPYYAYGIGVSILGVGGLLISVIDAFKAIDTEESLPRESSIQDGDTYECGREPASGVDVTLTTWAGRTVVSTTNVQGRAMLMLHPARFRLPPSGQNWATVEVEGVQPKQLTPPASALVTDVFASNDLEQFERFQQRFPNSSEWQGNLEPRYQQLVAELEAERIEAEEVRKVEHQQKMEEGRRVAEQTRLAEQEAWQKTAKSALAEAKRLGKKGLWDEAYNVLDDVGEFEEDPLNKKIQAASRTAIINSVRRLLVQRPRRDASSTDEDSYDVLIAELRSARDLMIQLGENRLVRKIEARIEKLEIERHVIAKGRFWVLTDEGSLRIHAPSTTGAKNALVRGLKAYLSTDLARTITAWAGCGPKCSWRIKTLGAKVDSAGTTLRVKLRITLVDSFGERRAGHHNYTNSFVDLDRARGRWTLDLNAFTVFTSMGL